MKAHRESFVIAMSPDERDALLATVWLVHGHLEDFFEDRGGDVENGTPEAKLMDAMGQLESFCRTIQNATYA